MGTRTVGTAKGGDGLLAIALAFFPALSGRFEFRLLATIEKHLLVGGPLVVAAALTIHPLSRTSRRPWRLTGLVGLLAVGRAMLPTGTS